MREDGGRREEEKEEDEGKEGDRGRMGSVLEKERDRGIIIAQVMLL